MKKIFAIAATAVALSALAGCYIGKAEFKGEDMEKVGTDPAKRAFFRDFRDVNHQNDLGIG